MIQLTEEQSKRLDEVRENRRVWHSNEGQTTRDIDFLLSLLDSDSQAAGQSPCANCWHADPHDGPAGAIDHACTHDGCDCGYYTPASQAAQSWHQWFDRLGAAATIEVVNATATLVIEERALYESARRNDAATSMRDKCVEKVTAKRDQRRKDLHAFTNDDNRKDDAEYTRAVLFILDNVINELKSLTLDPLEPEKQK